MSRIRSRYQGGAMLVEFAVVAGGLLVSLFLLTSMLGKLIDGRHDYEQGLRYATFERTVWFEGTPTNLPRNVPMVPVKRSDEIGIEVQARVFADRNALIRSNHRSGTVNETIDPMLMRPTAVMLNGQTSRYQPWLVDRANNNARPQYQRTQIPNGPLPGAVAGGVDRMFDGLRAVTRFAVNTDGLHRTRLEVDVDDVNYRRFPEFTRNNQVNGPPLDLRLDRDHDGRNPRVRQLALLADGWNVNGPEHARTRVRSLVATQFLDNRAIDTALNVFGALPMGRELRWLEFGKVEIEPVPQQRLGPYQ